MCVGVKLVSSWISRAASYNAVISDAGLVALTVHVEPDAVAPATNASAAMSSVLMRYCPDRSRKMLSSAEGSLKSMSCCEMNTPPATVERVTVLLAIVIFCDVTAAPSV